MYANFKDFYLGIDNIMYLKGYIQGLCNSFLEFYTDANSIHLIPTLPINSSSESVSEYQRLIKVLKDTKVKERITKAYQEELILKEIERQIDMSCDVNNNSLEDLLSSYDEINNSLTNLITRTYKKLFNNSSLV